MQKQIADTGRFSTKKMSTTGIGQVQKTMYYYLLGSGIESDIIPDYETQIDNKKQNVRLASDE